MTTVFNHGDKVRFTTELAVGDFGQSKREYLLNNMTKIFTVKKSIMEVCGEEVTLDDVNLEDCYFKPNELELVVEDSILTPKEYIKQFDDVVFKSLQKICELKGIELESSSELLSDIRSSIIAHMNDYGMDISIPKYKVGDTIYVDNEECKIISLEGNNRFAILSVTHYNVIAESYGIDLQTFISDLYNEGRIE